MQGVFAPPERKTWHKRRETRQAILQEDIFDNGECIYSYQ